jgi:hypothetical protein
MSCHYEYGTGGTGSALVNTSQGHEARLRVGQGLGEMQWGVMQAVGVLLPSKTPIRLLCTLNHWGTSGSEGGGIGFSCSVLN